MKTQISTKTITGIIHVNTIGQNGTKVRMRRLGQSSK